MFRFAATIFLSAFLLFQVQPLMGRYVLPWFGGSPAVWTVCMLLFQTLLPAGYAYAHLSTSRLSPRRQGAWHLAVLAASLVALPIIPDAAWKPLGGEAPTWRILGLLAATIGGPYFVLSTTGPLLQSWFAAAHPARSPLRLYALSNVGSLLALISYPFLVEPSLRLSDQARLWSCGYVVFALLCAWNAVQRMRSTPTEAPAAEVATPALPLTGNVLLGDKLFWIALSAVGSTMLLATTNQISQDVTVTPFLWILPLAIYLVSFILTFDAPRWYRRDVFGPLLAVAIAAAVYTVDAGPKLSFAVQVLIYGTTLFATTMVCHGELIRAKPASNELTMFYLLISIGGALGGAFTALVAPRLFSGFWEYQLSLAACGILFVVAIERSGAIGRTPGSRLLLRTAFLCGAVVLFSSLGKQMLARDASVVSAKRNFYGVLRVLEQTAAGRGTRRAMIHGRTIHGIQDLDDSHRREAAGYYGPESGVGLTLRRLRPPMKVVSDGYCGFASHPRFRVGVVGLGAGTLAVYAQHRDRYTFYEIDPDVARLAEDHFTYLRDAAMNVDVELGDARICLESQAGSLQFNVLAIDAFSGDSIPMHLLTRECFELYRRHLADDGVLALHISNNNVDLTPVVVGLSQEIGYDVRIVHSPADEARGVNEAVWALVTRNQSFLNDPEIAAAAKVPQLKSPPIVWTDDFGSLRQVLK